MTVALVPGSFDPITNGHLNIIKRACAMFDKVYVTVFINENKASRFTLEKRLEMVRAACSGLDNVICDKNEGMLADYCKEKGITAVVKGARCAEDFEYEMNMAHFNRERNQMLDTVILCAEKGLEEISSTALYKLISENRDYRGLVPDKVYDILSRLT
ncbi:MAG: pantetheine-phosphate adenylyltransferase [Clostridia bacterium]|nr:pantetheine-phosphate adenylyltransferase [Clostridia bacterium]